MGQPLHLITAQRYAEMVMFTGITLAMTETSSTETDAAALVNLKALVRTNFKDVDISCFGGNYPWPDICIQGCSSAPVDYGTEPCIDGNLAPYDGCN